MHPKPVNLVVNTEEEAIINPYASFSSSGTYSVSDFKVKDVRLTVSRVGYVLTDSPENANSNKMPNINNNNSVTGKNSNHDHSRSASISTSSGDDISVSSSLLTPRNSFVGDSPSSVMSISSLPLSSHILSSTISPSQISVTRTLHSSPNRSRNSSISQSIRQIRSSISPRSALEINSLDDLKILAPIGQGASGLVQSALHQQTGTLLALKQVPVDDTQHKSKQLLTEIRTLHHNTSPHIVSFYGAFYQERSMYMVLEHMDVGSLADFLKKLPHRSLPEQRLAAIANQVLHGLHYLHVERSTIHRDLKPSNILLNSAGLAKLADFGVSGMLGPEVAEKKMSFVGTVTYMSPERIQSLEHSYDSDIWSLGVTLLECVIGQFPYQAIEKKRKRKMDDLMGLAALHNNNNSTLSLSLLTSPSFSPASSPSTPSPYSNSELYDATHTTDKTPSKLPQLITPSPASSNLSSLSSSSFTNSAVSSMNSSDASSIVSTPSLSSTLPDPAPMKRLTSFCFWDIHQKIVLSPPPELPSNGDYSPELCDFIKICLNKDPTARPTSLALLSHPFIKRYANEDGSADSAGLSSYIQSQLAPTHAAISNLHIKQSLTPISGSSTSAPVAPSTSVSSSLAFQPISTNLTTISLLRNNNTNHPSSVSGNSNGNAFVFATTPTSSSSSSSNDLLISPRSSCPPPLISTPSSSSSSNSSFASSNTVLNSPHFVLPQATFHLTRSTSSTLPSFHPPPRLIPEGASSAARPFITAKRKNSLESIAAGIVSGLRATLKEKERENQENSKKKLRSSPISAEDESLFSRTRNEYSFPPPPNQQTPPLTKPSPVAMAFSAAFRPSLSSRFNSSISPFKYQPNASPANSPPTALISIPSPRSFTSSQFTVSSSSSSSVSSTSSSIPPSPSISSLSVSPTFSSFSSSSNISLSSLSSSPECAFTCITPSSASPLVTISLGDTNQI